MARRIRPISDDGIRSILAQINRLKKKIERTISFGNKINKETTIKRYLEEVESLIKGLMVRIYATIRVTKEATESIRLENIISSLAKGETNKGLVL